MDTPIVFLNLPCCNKTKLFCLLKEIIEAESIYNYDQLINCIDIDDWVFNRECESCISDPENGLEPKKTFVVSYNSEYIGFVEIRSKLSETSPEEGHIQIVLLPDYRAKGYGKRILKKAIAEAKDMIEDDRIVLTAEHGNIPSTNIIEEQEGVVFSRFHRNVDYYTYNTYS